MSAPEPTGARWPAGAHGPGGAGGPAGAAIELRDARAVLGGREIWRDVSLTVAPGELVAVLGPNGSGKSTLLKAILGLVATAPGSVSVLGRPAGAANELIGYVPQRHGFGPGLAIRGVDLVRLGLDGARWGVPAPPPLRRAARRRARERVRETIELVGAGAYAHRTVGELSGGEQQRLLIAQALVRGPRILMLDEPLDGLDLANQAAVTALVRDICRREEVAVLLVAHDVNPLLPHLDQVVYLAGGRALQGPVGEVVTGAKLSALYGVPIEVLRTRDGRLVVVGQPEAPHVHGSRHGHDHGEAP